MRVIILGLAALAAACAAQVSLPASQPHSAWPFPQAPRGSAMAPPQAEAQIASAPQASAPPEGRAAGGIDFGSWRSAEPAAYQMQFQAQMRTRLASQNAGQIRTDLEANGFSCTQGTGAPILQCRIETRDNACNVDWYVVVEQAGGAPIVGFDRMCFRR